MSSTICYSPRTERRRAEKQQRRDMAVSDDIADKLHHGFINDSSFLSSTSKGTSLKPNSSHTLKNNKSKAKDLNQNADLDRIEQIMGAYSEVKQLNLARMSGVSYFNSTPSPGTSWREFKELKDKRRHDPLSSATTTTALSRKPQRCDRDGGDLRNKLSRRSCPDSRSSSDIKSGSSRGVRHRNQQTSRSATENFLEFTKIPSKSDRVKKSSSREALSGRRSPSSSTERDKTANSTNNKTANSTNSRQSRKRACTNWSDADIDSDSSVSSSITPSDLTKLSFIFDLMGCDARMSPLHQHSGTIQHTTKLSRLKLEDVPSSGGGGGGRGGGVSRKEKDIKGEKDEDEEGEEEEEEDDEEYDLSRFEEKLKNEGRLPSSPANPPLQPPSVSASRVCAQQSASLEPTGGADDQHDTRLSEGEISDVDSDYDTATFSKPVLENPVKNLKVETQKPKDKTDTSCHDDVAPSKSSSGEGPAVGTTTREVDICDKREIKPVVAVNPLVKSSSNSQTPSSITTMEDLLGQVRSGVNPQDVLTAARGLLVPPSNAEMIVSIGIDKLSLRTLRNNSWLTTLPETTKIKEEDTWSSADEKTDKPREKPSCIVPGIPRTDKIKQEEGLQRSSPSSGTSLRDDREYYQRKRRRLPHDPAEYDQLRPPPYPYPGAVAIPSIAYLQLQQPDHLMGLMGRSQFRSTFPSYHDDEHEKEDIEKDLKKLYRFEEYTIRAKAYRNEAEAAQEQTEKIKKFMLATIEWIFSALKLAESKEIQKAYNMLHDTLRFVDFCLQLHSRRGNLVRLQDKRLAVMCMMLFSSISRQMWLYRKLEYTALQDRCQTYYRSHFRKKDDSSRLQPNKGGVNSTPSPASSIHSVSSYTGGESVDGGSSSSRMDTVPSRLLQDTYKYFKLAQHLYDWLDYWNQATLLAKESIAFFHQLDEQCSSLKPTSHLYTVAKYISQGLSYLDTLSKS